LGSTPAFWLDSAGNTGWPVSFMGSAGGRGQWLSTLQKVNVLNFIPGKESSKHFLFDYLKTELQNRLFISDLPFDFNGGFVGYLGYELKAECGAGSGIRRRSGRLSHICGSLIAFDHKEHSVYLRCGPQ
jgi:para-aminobenzoate synthetase